MQGSCDTEAWSMRARVRGFPPGRRRVVVSGAMAARKPRRLPELSADERHRQLFAKYGDLTGGGLVAPTIAQAGELMMRVATSQSAAATAAASGRDSLTEYVTKRDHELHMAQMDERMRQLGEELRRREQAHDELARLVQQLLARGGASPSDDLAHSMGYSRARPLAGQHGYPLAEHPVNAMQPLQPLGGLGSNPGSAGPEVDPSQSTGAAGLPLVPMLALPSAPQPHGSLHDGGGAYDDGGFFAGGAASEGGDSAERDAMDDELMLAELGPLGDEGVLGDEGAAGTHDVEPPERTVGEAGTCQLTEAEGFAQVLALARTRTCTRTRTRTRNPNPSLTLTLTLTLTLKVIHLELQYVSPVVIAVALPDADADADADSLLERPPIVAVVERTPTSFTLTRLPCAGVAARSASLLVGYVVVEQGLHRQLVRGVRGGPLGGRVGGGGGAARHVVPFGAGICWLWVALCALENRPCRSKKNERRRRRYGPRHPQRVGRCGLSTTQAPLCERSDAHCRGGVAAPAPRRRPSPRGRQHADRALSATLRPLPRPPHHPRRQHTASAAALHRRCGRPRALPTPSPHRSPSPTASPHRSLSPTLSPSLSRL